MLIIALSNCCHDGETNRTLPHAIESVLERDAGPLGAKRATLLGQCVRARSAARRGAQERGSDGGADARRQRAKPTTVSESKSLGVVAGLAGHGPADGVGFSSTGSLGD